MRPSPVLRRFVPVIAVSALVLAACGSDDDVLERQRGRHHRAAAGPTAHAGGHLQRHHRRRRPDDRHGRARLPPVGHRRRPESGEGFEAAVAYAVAAEMGYDKDSVVWVRTTFDEAIQPGPKNFDVNLQQYSITEERKENINFSLPYYTSNQAIVALDGSAAEGATTIADLKDVKFGAQVGTTSLDFINEVIQPTQDVFVYDDNVGAKAALEANQIDAAVFDLPTALYVSGVEIEGSSVVGQFPADAGGTSDQFGMRARTGQPAHRVRRPGDHDAHRERRTRRHHPGVAVRLHRRAGDHRRVIPATPAAHDTLHDRSTDPARALRAGSTPAVERHRRDQHDHRRRGADRVRPEGTRMGTGPPGVLRRRRVPGELSRSGQRVLARRADPAVVDPADPDRLAADRPRPQHPQPGAVPTPGVRGDLHRRVPRDPGDPARVPHRVRRSGAGVVTRVGQPVDLGHRDARAVVLGVHRRDHPLGHRRCAREPASGGAVAGHDQPPDHEHA